MTGSRCCIQEIAYTGNGWCRLYHLSVQEQMQGMLTLGRCYLALDTKISTEGCSAPGRTSGVSKSTVIRQSVLAIGNRERPQTNLHSTNTADPRQATTVALFGSKTHSYVHATNATMTRGEGRTSTTTALFLAANAFPTPQRTLLPSSSKFH